VEVLIALTVLGIAVLLIVGPLRRAGRAKPPETARPDAFADLEAAKEAKYREIRDAELDYRTGKLSEEDWQLLDSSLRAEAVAVLHRLDALEKHRPREEDRPPA
jgi:hypothetical protein